MSSPKIEQKNKVITMNFYEALKEVFTNGRRVSRLSWDSNEEYFFMFSDEALGVHHQDGKDYVVKLRKGDAIGTDFFLLPEAEEKLKN